MFCLEHVRKNINSIGRRITKKDSHSLKTDIATDKILLTRFTVFPRPSRFTAAAVVIDEIYAPSTSCTVTQYILTVIDVCRMTNLLLVHRGGFR